MLQSMELQTIGHGLATEQQPHWLLLRRTLTSTPGDNKTQWCHSYWLASNGTEQGGKQERVEPDGKWSFTIFFKWVFCCQSTISYFLNPCDSGHFSQQCAWPDFFSSLATKGNRYKRENTFSKESPVNHFYWHIVAIQCCVSFRYTAKWSHKCVYISPLPWISFPFRSPQTIE